MMLGISTQFSKGTNIIRETATKTLITQINQIQSDSMKNDIHDEGDDIQPAMPILVCSNQCNNLSCADRNKVRPANKPAPELPTLAASGPCTGPAQNGEP